MALRISPALALLDQPGDLDADRARRPPSRSRPPTGSGTRGTSSWWRWPAPAPRWCAAGRRRRWPARATRARPTPITSQLDRRKRRRRTTAHDVGLLVRGDQVVELGRGDGAGEALHHGAVGRDRRTSPAPGPRRRRRRCCSRGRRSRGQSPPFSAKNSRASSAVSSKMTLTRTASPVGRVRGVERGELGCSVDGTGCTRWRRSSPPPSGPR